MKSTEQIIDEHFDDSVKFKERKRWGFLGLPFTFTVYTLTDSILTVKSGFLSTQEEDCYMYKIQDVKLTRSLAERLFGTGTILLYTGDASTPNIELKHVKNSKAISSFIIKASEAARIKRRTVNMQDITAGDIESVLDN